MENWTQSMYDLHVPSIRDEWLVERNAMLLAEDRAFRALNPLRHTAAGRGSVRWYVPEGAEFDSEIEHGWGPRDFQYGENPWAFISESHWHIEDGDVDLRVYDDEVEDWEVQAPLRPALRPHAGVFEEYDQLHIPTREVMVKIVEAWNDPKLAVKEERMTAQTGLSRKHLKKYDRQVASLLMEIVNDHGIRYRVQDGGHMLLYPPDGESQPFKVAAARKPEAQVFYLRKFMTDWNLEPKEKEMTTTTFAAIPKGSGEVAAERAAAEPVAPEPIEEPEAAEEPVLEASDPSGWQPTDRYAGKWEVWGDEYRCATCREAGEEFISSDGRGIVGHQNTKHGDGAIWSAEAKAKATETRRAKKMQRDVAEAVALIAKAVGIEPAMDEKEVQSLRDQLAAETKRADEAEARLALIRETMGL